MERQVASPAFSGPVRCSPADLRSVRALPHPGIVQRQPPCTYLSRFGCGLYGCETVPPPLCRTVHPFRELMCHRLVVDADVQNKERPLKGQRVLAPSPLTGIVLIQSLTGGVLKNKLSLEFIRTLCLFVFNGIHFSLTPSGPFE